eukprot:5705032-Pyramimonas_sp.AAC.1
MHLAEVDKFRATLSRELNSVKSLHEFVELVRQHIHKNWQDLPHITADAPHIEECMEYVLQSQAAALLRGKQVTFDAVRHSATEKWALHVYEAAVYALHAWAQHG